jgi:hypothetical protein
LPKYRLILPVISVLVLTQLMCSFASITDPSGEMTAVAKDVQNTVIAIQRTNNPAQIVFPTIDVNQEKTAAAAQIQVPTPLPSKPTAVLQPANSSQPGSIAGSLSYPAESVPALTVAAYHVINGVMTGETYLVDTQAGQMTYQIVKVPAGKYFVVVYLRKGTLPGINGLAGGYSKYVICGATPGCSDHSLVEVTVFPDTMTGDINPQDWYAPANSFPPEPPK